jgi:hypothetical protein
MTILFFWWMIGMYSYATGQNLINKVGTRSWRTSQVFRLPIIGLLGIFVTFWCALIVNEYNRKR